ncbi:MAG: asparagine synthase (glutamine-hydrolyzing) [Candidatus Omnitrophica bacterium]|nr:asparagine synthase (glutamine-hydrolyzing) [Candidatus Omnitrophota bacterium]
MCGITGIINLDYKKIGEELVYAMTDSLAHRGPDGRGIYVDNYIGLGHRRLAVIDLSKRAAQPMCTEDKNFIISYNGEVYNFKELRKSLERKGVKFKSQSDTEVVLQSFIRWGVDSFNFFNGMFAFAVWDKKNKILTLARDRYGIKPLYYWQNDKVFLFSSEIKAFLKHPEFRVDLDLETLLEYFTFQNTFTYKTMFKDVKILPPGHFLQIFSEGGLKIDIKQYWDFHFEEDAKIKSKSEYIEELDRLFHQAIKWQLVSDVEVGSFLSGGIDSGSITAIAAQHFKNLKTFCVGFDLSSASGLELSFDERKKAEYLSYLCQTEHYEIVLKSGDMQRCLPEVVWCLEDLRMGQSYPNLYASKLASKFVKVCLSGIGSDEIFAGYPWRYYRTVRSKSFDEYIKGYYKYWQRLVSNKDLKQLFSPIGEKIRNVWTEDIFKNVFGNHKLIPQTPQDYINHSLYFEAKTFLHGLLVMEDKLNMSHSLEVRVPFLDNDLVDFAMKIPVELKLKNIDKFIRLDENDLAKQNKYFQKMRDGKMILRNVSKKYIPKKISNQYKQGFSGPDASWFKGESIEYVKNTLLNKNAVIYDYFDFKTVNNLINEHVEGKHNRRLFIWSLLCFEGWLKLFLGGDYKKR